MKIRPVGAELFHADRQDLLFVVTTHCGCIFHSPVAGFSLLVFEVS